MHNAPAVNCMKEKKVNYVCLVRLFSYLCSSIVGYAVDAVAVCHSGCSSLKVRMEPLADKI